jgi:hypothetical protein
MLLGHDKYAAFRSKFGLYEYPVMPFELTNAPAVCQRQINRVLRLVLGIKLGINTDIRIDKDEGMVVVAYINDIIIATTGSVEKYRRQVVKVIDLLLDNMMCGEIDKCGFEQTEASIRRFIGGGQSIRMDPAKPNEMVDWTRPTNQTEVRRILGFWNLYQRFVPNYAQILPPITDFYEEMERISFRR